MAESKEELNSLLMRVREEREKAGLKLNIQKQWLCILPHHFMANRWGNSGNSGRFYFLVLQNHCSDYSHEMKRHLLLGRKAVTSLDSLLKSRPITLLTKTYIVKAMVSPVVMDGCASWTNKKSEHWRIDAFELCCWRRLLRVLWTAGRSNQFILKEICSE